MLVLTRADIAGVLPIEAVIDAVEAAHRAVALGTATEGARSAVALPHADALLIPMSAAIGPLHASGMKLLTDSPANPAQGFPRQQSVVLLLDPDTHAVEALLDGAEITRLRTAAASAVATRYLARADSTTLGLVGAGALARTHLQAIRAVRAIERVIVWSRTNDTVARFIDSVDADGIELVAADTVEHLAAQANIICTLTPTRTPLLRGSWLRPGTHVNAVGAPPRSGYREIDTDVITRSRVVVDDRRIALHESDALTLALSDGALNEAQLHDELGDVVCGHVTGRRDDQEITLFNSVGLAIQDLATARLLVDLARHDGFGIDVALTAASHAVAL